MAASPLDVRKVCDLPSRDLLQKKLIDQFALLFYDRLNTGKEVIQFI